MAEQDHGEYVTFVGGPMDGYRMPVDGWKPESRREGVAHMCDTGRYGIGGRAWYSPPEDHPSPETATEWTHDGDSA